MSTTSLTLLCKVRDLQDHPSWKRFDDTYRPMLQRYVRERGLSSEEAAEIAQECMAAIAAGIRRFQRRCYGSFRAWLRRMINNKVSDALRRKCYERNGKTAEIEHAQGDEANPAHAWERNWNRAHLLYCLEAVRGDVSDLTYDIFFRYVLHEEEVGDICAALQVTPNQVYVAKHRVLKRLKERLAKAEDGLEPPSRADG